MDKDNKYYEIIKDLVQNHKKYPGLEQILDEIIDDVFSHSEVIINSVNNSEVINTYLGKVVSTSMITVPKRLKFKTYTQIDEQTSNKRTNALVDQMINATAISEADKYKDLKNQNTMTEEDSEFVNKTSIEDSNQNSDSIFEDLTNENDDGDLPIDTAVIEEITEDKTENILDNTQDNEIIDYNEATPLIDQETEDITSYDNNSLDEILETESTEVNNEHDVFADEENEIRYNIENEQEHNEEDLTDILEEKIDLDSDEKNQEQLVEDNIFNAIEEDEDVAETFDIEEEKEKEEEEESYDLLENDNDETDFSDLNNQTIQEDNNIIKNIEVNQNKPEENDTSYDKGLYSAFEFSIENFEDNSNDYNTEMLSKDLSLLDQKHPELNVNSIYNLKYKSNKTVSDIATELNIDEEKVINTLNEIIAII